MEIKDEIGAADGGRNVLPLHPGSQIHPALFEDGAAAEVNEDIFKKMEVPDDASCLFWAVTAAYLLPVRNNHCFFKEKFEILFGVENVNKALRIQQLLMLNHALNFVYEDEVLIDLVRRVFRHRVVGEMMKLEMALFQRVTLNDFIRMKNEAFITDGKFSKQFQSTFPSQLHLIDLIELKPDELNENSMAALNRELDKVLDFENVQKFKFRSYLNAVRGSESWAGELEVEAIRQLLKRDILVFTNESTKLGINTLRRNICLFNSNGIHYKFGLVHSEFVMEILKNKKNYRLPIDYIDLGVDRIDYQDENGNSLLHFAALSDNSNDVVNKLIWQGADVHLRNNSDKTPPDLAIDFKLRKAIAALDLYINQTNLNTHDIALTKKHAHVFSIEGIYQNESQDFPSKTIVFESLDERGKHAIMYEKNAPLDDHAALYLAVINNHLKGVESLIENGTDVNIKDYCIAIQNKEDVNNPNCSHWTSSPLHYAGEKGYLDIVKALIEKGKAEVDIKDYRGGTPLRRAAKFGHLNVIKYLIGKGASVNSFDKTLVSALTYAAKAGHAHIVQYLIEHGAELKAVDQRGMSALHHAAECNRVNVVHCLVEHKADLNLLDGKNRTALEMVQSVGNWGIVQYLLENGALLTDITAADIRDNIFNRFILEHDDGEKQFYHAIKLGNVELLKILLDNHRVKSNEMIICEMLAKAYDELKLLNVKLNQNILFFIEEKLTSFRFISSNEVKIKPNDKTGVNLIDIRSRINLVISCIDEIILSYGEKDDKVDDIFLFIGKFIAGNFHILKMQLSFTYEVLPWEEIQFCLLTFISSYAQQQQQQHPEKIEIVNELIMHKRRLLSHLKLFRSKLVDVVIGDNELNNKKKIFRDKAVENILKISPEFKDLYSDFEILKDVYSLNRIEKYIKVAVTVDLKTKPVIGQLVIKRALQVLGECLKNTSDSPNMSESVQDILITNAPLDVKQIITSLRDSLSHEAAATTELELSDSEPEEIFFLKMQNDLKKVQMEVSFILNDKKTRAMAMFLERISECENVNEVYAAVIGVRASYIPESIGINGDARVITLNYYLKIKELLRYLDNNYFVVTKTPFQAEKFRDINEALEEYETSIENVRSKYFTNLENLRRFISSLKTKKNDQLDAIKNESRRLASVVNLEMDDENRNVCSKISNLTLDLYNSIVIKNSALLNLFYQIFSTVHFEGMRMKSIETFKFNFEKEVISNKKFANDKLISEKILKKMFRLIDKISDAEIAILFKEEYDEKKNFHETRNILVEFCETKCSLEITNEERFAGFMKQIGCKLVKNETYSSLYAEINASKGQNLLRRLKRMTNSYSKLSAKLSDEPTNPFVQEAFIEFIHSFEVVKKLPRDFVSNKSLFFDVEIYFRLLKTIEDILRACGETDFDRLVKLLETNDEVRLAIEMLMLTLTELLDNLSLLETNRLFLDETSPNLIGKNLRNYLAHGDLLMDILSIDHLKSIIVHYTVFNSSRDEENFRVYTDNNLIGKITIENVSELKENYERQLELLNKHNRLFSAVIKSNDDDDEIAIKSLINNNLEINVRTINGLTALHGSLVNDNVEIFKFLLTKNFNIYQKDARGNSIISYLPQLGSKNILQLLLNECSIDIDANLGSRNNNNIRLLHLACRFGKNEIVKLLIAHGANVDANDNDGNTPLHYATINGHLNVILTLLNAGANLDHKNKKDGDTLLHSAARGGFSYVTNYLINKGLSVHDVSETKHTPLHIACVYGHRNIVDIMLERGAHVNARGMEGETALHIAAQEGHDEIIQRLVTFKGVKIGAVDSRGETVLHVAAYNGFEAIVEILMKNNFDKEVKNGRGSTPLHNASMAGHHKVVKLLLENNARVNALSTDLSALHFAAKCNHREVVKILIDNEADVTIKSIEGTTALHLAAEEENIEIMEMLLASASNAGINEVDNEGRTPLHLAVLSNRNKSVEVLVVSQGAEINCRDEGGNTPLLMASMNGYVTIFDSLRRNNASVSIKNKENLTPFYASIIFGHAKLVEKLIPYDVGADGQKDLGNTPLQFAAINGYDNIVKILIKHGANVNEQLLLSLDQHTPLYLASQNGHYTTVTQLLRKNADVNATNGTLLVTALHVAAAYGHADIAQVLLKFGAHVDALDVNNATPLHRAAETGQSQIIPVLCNYETNVDAKMVSNVTPIHLAAEHGHGEFIEKLHSHGANIYELNEDGGSILHFAIQRDHIKVIETILHLDDNLSILVNQESSSGVSLLHRVAQEGRADIVRLMLAHNANVNCTNSNGCSALHSAIVKGHKSIVEMLCEAGASVNSTLTDDGFSPLNLALQIDDSGNDDKGSSKIDITEILIRNGADIFYKNSHFSVIHQAVNDIDILKLILKEIQMKLNGDAEKLRSALNVADAEGYSPLMWAVDAGNVSAAKLLLECDEIDIDKQSFSGWSALYMAVQNEDIEITEMLIRHGANVFAENNYCPCSVLHRAVNNIDVLNLVLVEIRSKCDGDEDRLRLVMNVSDADGDTPLMWAVEKGHLIATKVLLESEEIDINKQNLLGWTALHWAAQGGHLQIVSLLLIKKADVEIQDKNLETAFDLAVHKITEDEKFRQIVDLISNEMNVSK